MSSRVFGHGDLRLYLLKLLEDGAKHGYELIKMLEDRFMGMYSPSPGTVYPRLSALEEDGLVVAEELDGRKVYRLTDKGREELTARKDEVEQVGRRVAQSARELAKQIRDEVRSSVRDLRQDMREEAQESRERDRSSRGRDGKAFTIDIGRELRRVVRDVQREERRVAREVKQDVRGVLRTLQRDLEAFVTDVIAAARRNNLDADRMNDLREVLLEAREQVIDALAGRRRRDDV